MTRAPVLLVAAVLTGTVVASGCGVGPGESAEGSADLRVTRDFGADELIGAGLEDPTESDTVVRFLDQNAEIETSFGGNFVDSIDGLAGSTIDGGAEDWFFFVNGYYSDIGAGEAVVEPDDRIWWDHRDWTEAYRVPAVVGSWPQPFLDAGLEVVVECVGGEPAPVAEACDTAVAALEGEGVEVTREDVAEPVEHPDDLRVLVGAYAALRSDPAARQLEDGPSVSGVYAEVAPCDVGHRFEILGSDGRPRQQLSANGLVAAVRLEDDQPTWLVTGTGPDAVDDAAGLLTTEALRDRYAVVGGKDGEAFPVPAPEESPVREEVVCG